MSWQTIFMPSTSIVELLARGTVLYLGIFVVMRVSGRRESGELNVSDLILIMLVSEAASAGLNGQAHSILDSLIVVVTIIFWNVALDAAGFRWKWAQKLFKPTPQILIADGQLNLRTARRELMTRSEIHSELRKQGVEEISSVYRAYVEPSGTISVLTRPDVEP